MSEQPAADLEDDALRSTDAEEDIIAILLADPTKRDEVFRLISPDLMTEPILRRVFMSIKMLHLNGRAISPTSVSESLVTDADLFDLGGFHYLTEVAQDAYQRRGLAECVEGLRTLASMRREDEDLARRREELRSPVELSARTAEHADDGDGGHTKADADGLGEWDAGDDRIVPAPRGWLLGNTFCRKFISSLLGDGGVGKTALRVAQLLSLATNRPLTGEHVFQRCRVLIISLEDDEDELRRRVLAARIHYQISNSDLKGWLFLAAPGGSAGKFMIGQDGKVTRGELAARIEAVILKRRIDIICVDPFVKTHSVEENSNSAIDDVVQMIAGIAVKYNCAFDVPHHMSKGAADPGNANRGRGASAMKDGARLVYTASKMTNEEAEASGVGKVDRRFLFRVDSAKVNIAPPRTEAKWFRLIGVQIGNATELYPAGDEVQTVEPWMPPDIWQGISTPIANAILSDIDAGLPDGERYSDASAATERGAWRVVLRHAPEVKEGVAREVIKIWIKKGVLVKANYDSPARREPVMGLKLDPAKRPT